MPCVAFLLPIDGLDDSENNPEALPLHLPSSLTAKLREQLVDLAEKEERLQFAQADDSLSEIRRHRRILTGLYQFKKLNVSGTGNRPNTHMYGLFKQFNDRIDRFASRYHLAYTALSCLSPSGSWTAQFKKLEPGDISGPGKEDRDASNGRFEPSWIWLVPRLSTEPVTVETELQLEDCMRVDWAKAQARLLRWEEEVELIQEEMRRVVTYLLWQADWWRLKVAGAHGVTSDPSLWSGLGAYAESQADMFDSLAASSAACWLPVLHMAGVEPEWGGQFFETSPKGRGSEGGNIATSSADDDVESWILEEKEEDDDDELSAEIADVDFFDADF
ncbi:hypothetical protein H0H92_004083 [Tricholoma furcatifolium]|nr:hypothetical protein H0H92_004083 [Tricholoma furcatifolium]